MSIRKEYDQYVIDFLGGRILTGRTVAKFPDGSKGYGIMLQELGKPAMIGEDFKGREDEADFQGPRVILVFKHPESIDVIVESLLKTKAKFNEPNEKAPEVAGS